MKSCKRIIANVMLGRGRGGIEQAFLDYNEALALAGFRPIPIISRGASVEPRVRDSGIEYCTLSQWGWWDVVAAGKLRGIFTKEKVAAVITHGNRALSLASLWPGSTPVIPVVHNYNIGRVERARAAIVTTADLKKAVVERRGRIDNLFIIPNVTHVTRPPPTAIPFRDPPVVGVMGRMVEKKGFDKLCVALASLKSHGLRFRAIIAGDGEARPELERTIRSLALDADVTLTGWIDGAAKEAFWSDIDIFCLPSLHEPFGIAMLEAWAAGKAVVATDTEGPRAIATDGSDAMIVAANNPDALAQAVGRLLEQPERVYALAQNGYSKVVAEYSLPALAKRLSAVIGEVVA